MGLFFETISLFVKLKFNDFFIKVGLVFVLFSAFIIRMIIIDFGLPSKNLTLTTYNPDEPLSYYTIEKWLPTATKKLDFHPRRVFLWGGFHLYPLAASIGIGKMLGYVKLGDRNFFINNLREADKLYLAGRFLMILFAIGTVFVLFLILKKSYGGTIGLFGAFLLAIVPAHIVNSIYVRPDIMMLFLDEIDLKIKTVKIN